MPSLFILSWISLFIGPFYYPVLNQALCFIMILIASFKLTLFGLVSFYLLYQNWRVLKQKSKFSSKKREEVGE